MPLSQKEYQPCSSCQSKNVAGRVTCWRCGSDLPRPASIARSLHDTRYPLSQDTPPAVFRAVPESALWTQAALDDLLSQATCIDLSKPRKFSVIRRKAVTVRAVSLRNAARREKRPSLLRPAHIENAKRAATALSLTLLAAAASSVSVAHKTRPTARKSAFKSLKAQDAMLPPAPETKIADAAPSEFSLEAEKQKIQADLDARTREFLTTGLNMVRDYESANGSLIPDPAAPASHVAQLEGNASYTAYVAHMKFLLMKEGVI